MPIRPSEQKLIPTSVQAIEVNEDAVVANALMAVLRDMDLQRIAKDDSAIVRKTVLAFVPLIADLEARLARLEAENQSRRNSS